MPKIIDTHSPNYPMIEGIPYTEYNADEVFIQQMDKHFPGLFKFEVVSRRGNNTRTDVLLKGSFVPSYLSSHSFYVYVFILYEGGKGRAHDDELRTQLTAGSSWAPSLTDSKIATAFRDNTSEKDAIECYCIGIYKQDASSDNVAFVGMPCEVLCKSENEKINPTSTFQTYGELLQKAYINGVFLHKKNFTASSTYNLLNFLPQYFLWYMKHRDQIHVQDIDKALDVLKTIHSFEELKFKGNEPLQLIFYGAPGTGKSFAIDNQTNDSNTVRTTFHPDSDYASFVGAYKPTMADMPINAIVGTTVHHANFGEEKGNAKAYEKKIVYKFVPQAFLKAYVAAWGDLENPHFLVIEEINRGNCAQIFGDLFQLLDRNSQGASSFAIHADEDIARFLEKDKKGFVKLSDEQKDAIRSFVLTKDNGKTEEIGEAILNGEKLLLPPNLYIWATMNTSDQSLFPIDSAFKRRWNWRYVPIKFFENDSDISLSKRAFEIKETLYSWASFLKIMNPIISELTESADKQMGFFFAKPDKRSDEKGIPNPDLKANDVISEDIFVNKVLFYLWSDVLKDYNIGHKEFQNPDKKGKQYEFTDFFISEKNYLSQFITALGVAKIGNEPSKPEENAASGTEGSETNVE